MIESPHPTTSPEASFQEDRLDAPASSTRREALDGLRASIADVTGDRLDPAEGHGGRGWSRRRRHLESWTSTGRSEASDSDSKSDGSPPPSVNPAVASSATRSSPPVDRLATGWACRQAGADASLDERLEGGLVIGAIHEFLGDGDDLGDPDHAGSSGDSTAVPISRPIPNWMPCCGPVCAVLRRLHRDRTTRGRSPLRTIWVGDRCRPTLSALGSLDDGSLAIRARLIGDASTSTDRRWCVEQAIRTPAIDAVVADARDFSLLDTRRLQIAMAVRGEAGHPSITVLLVRPTSDRRCRSAATTRWIVATDGDVDAFGSSPSWRLRLVRARMPQLVAHAHGDPTGLVAFVRLGGSPASTPASPTASPTIFMACPRTRPDSIDAARDHADTPRVATATNRGDRPADLHRRPGANPPPPKESTRARKEGAREEGARGRRGRRGARLRGTAWSPRGDGLLFPGS